MDITQIQKNTKEVIQNQRSQGSQQLKEIIQCHIQVQF